MFNFPTRCVDDDGACKTDKPVAKKARGAKVEKAPEPQFVVSFSPPPDTVCEFGKPVLGSTYKIAIVRLPAQWESAPWYTALTLRPVVSSCCPVKPPPFTPVFQDKVNNILHLPRFYGMLTLGKAAKDTRVRGVDMQPEIAFEGTLSTANPPQVQATTAVLAQLHALGGATLVLPCGFGKTVCSLWLAFQLRRRTLILVHSEALADQWCDRITTFLPKAVIGRIQQDTVQVEGTDFVVGLIQSVVKRDYDQATVFDTFGLVIVDEAHHVAAPMFSKALPKLKARYVLGLSATPNRSDGLGVALEWLLGPIAFKAQRVFERVTVNMITYTRGDELEVTNRRGDPMCSTMLTNLAVDQIRTDFIVEQIATQAATGRNVIVLSDRLDQLQAIETQLQDKHSQFTVGRVVGGMKAAQRDAGFQARILLSTYTYASEGIDIPRLDTLVMATPRGNIEQTVGRILRPHPTKQEPLVIDIRDNFSMFSGMSWKRFSYYKGVGYTVRFTYDREDYEPPDRDACFF